MSDFFAAAGGCVLPAVFRGLNFCKKNKPCKACTAKGRSVEKPLLPQIKYSTKYVKLQDVNYIYSIPYFPQNTTAKSQNLPAMHRQPRCSSADKKEAPLSRHLRLQSKNFGLQGLFPSACSIHAFISAASVLKSFSKTTSISFILCRPNFR